MNLRKKTTKKQDFKYRKLVHYFLLACILLIQVTIAGFFYNEFHNKEQLHFIDKQLEKINQVEKLTDQSKIQLQNAQNNFQQYLSSGDEHYLNSYLTAVNLLTKNLDDIKSSGDNSRLKNRLQRQEKNTGGLEDLKIKIDSTVQTSRKLNYTPTPIEPKLKKFDFKYSFDQYDIETRTYSEPAVKKGIFGRIGDAITGKENVAKDSTVVTMKEGKANNLNKIKSDIDSIFNEVNNYYAEEIKKIEVTITKNNRNNLTQNTAEKNNIDKINTAYSALMTYSNDLTQIYEKAVSDSKSELEKEYAAQNSETNTIRKNLVIGLMILMFIVSVLLMYLTRIGFVLEEKLNKANEQIEENLKFKNRILGMLSHELRSPLKIISIFIKRINNKTTDPTVKEYLKSISFTNNTLLMQANQILEYTKNQQVGNKLIPVAFNLKEEINSILNAIEPYLETRNNALIIKENIDSNLIVFTDNTKINQIFINILGNANKFTENGKIEVTTFTENIDEKTVFLKTSISDTGAGISQTDLKKIFEPYYQGIISDEVENLGARLGLSLCKEIIELYEGTIEVTSGLNEGTTVKFNLKLNIDERAN